MKRPGQRYNMEPVVPSLNFEDCAPLGVTTPINVRTTQGTSTVTVPFTSDVTNNKLVLISSKVTGYSKYSPTRRVP